MATDPPPRKRGAGPTRGAKPQAKENPGDADPRRRFAGKQHPARRVPAELLRSRARRALLADAYDNDAPAVHEMLGSTACLAVEPLPRKRVPQLAARVFNGGRDRKSVV